MGVIQRHASDDAKLIISIYCGFLQSCRFKMRMRGFKNYLDG